MIKKSGGNAVLAGLCILLSGACSFLPSVEAEDNDITLTYTVTYNANGADSATLSKSTEVLTSGKTISTAPTGISRAGYTLSGWNTKANGSGTAFLFGTTAVSSDLTLFAQWKADITLTHTVTYNANGADSATLSKSTEVLNSGETVSTAPTGISRAGYTLSGWNTKTDGSGTVFLFGTTAVISDLTLFAQWLKIASFSSTIFDNALKDGFTAMIESSKGTRQASLDTAVDAGSTAGGSSIKIDLSADSSWGGGYIQDSNGADLSDSTELSFALNASRLNTSVDYIEFKLEDSDGQAKSVNVFDLTLSETHGEWKTYTVDLTQFSNLNFSRFKAIGLWHPRAGGSEGVYRPGTFFIDDIEFTGTETQFTKLVWSDEFNGTDIDRNNWIYDLGTGAEKGLNGWGNNELQYYTDRSENARIEDVPGGGRALVIEARKESYQGSSYTSARLLTQGLRDWTYGRIEARIKLPVGQGIWPAFWMLGSNISTNPWPECGEIDIMEYLGHEPSKVHGTIHYGRPHAYEGDSYSLPNGNFSDDFHVFGIIWSEGEIRWTVDGETYLTKRNWSSSLDDFPAPFDRPFFILLNLAVGGTWPGYPDSSTTFPQKMYVDWVRVYY